MQDYSPRFYFFSHSNVVVDIDLTSTPDDKNIGIEYCQKIWEKVSPIATLILHNKYRQFSKSIADTIGSSTITAM